MFFSNANEFEIRSELTWHVDLEADQLVGPVVELVEQNALEMVPEMGLVAERLRERLRPMSLAVETKRYECQEGEFLSLTS